MREHRHGRRLRSSPGCRLFFGDYTQPSTQERSLLVGPRSNAGKTYPHAACSLLSQATSPLDKARSKHERTETLARMGVEAAVSGKGEPPCEDVLRRNVRKGGRCSARGDEGKAPACLPGPREERRCWDPEMMAARRRLPRECFQSAGRPSRSTLPLQPACLLTVSSSSVPCRKHSRLFLVFRPRFVSQPASPKVRPREPLLSVLQSGLASLYLAPPLISSGCSSLMSRMWVQTQGRFTTIELPVARSPGAMLLRQPAWK